MSARTSHSQVSTETIEGAKTQQQDQFTETDKRLHQDRQEMATRRVHRNSQETATRRVHRNSQETATRRVHRNSQETFKRVPRDCKNTNDHRHRKKRAKRLAIIREPRDLIALIRESQETVTNYDDHQHKDILLRALITVSITSS